MDNDLDEEIRSIKQIVTAILIVVVILLIMQLKEMPKGLKLDELFNIKLFSRDKQDVATKQVSSSQGLQYPKDKTEAIFLYNKYSETNAATNRVYTFDELASDSIKTKYLVRNESVKDYAGYLSYANNKAFAVATMGAYGYSGGDRVTLDVAVDEALTYCNKYKSKDDLCYVIDINGLFIGNLKE